MELTYEQLVELDQGKPADPRAVFFEQAVLDPQESQRVGHRVYDKRLYVRLTQPGVKDSVSYEAQREDIQNFAEEFQYFQRTRQGTKMPGIEIIPNLDIAHLQELRDMQLLTIPQLAAVEVVPPHLEYARRAAIVFNSALEETSHAKQEESYREEAIGIKAEDVSAENRFEHHRHVERPEVPRSNGHREVRETAQGNGAHRRPQRHHGVDWGNVRIA